jgi:phage gp36-like protein
VGDDVCDEIAKYYLESNGWNLEKAWNEYKEDMQWE